MRAIFYLWQYSAWTMALLTFFAILYAGIRNESILPFLLPCALALGLGILFHRLGRKHPHVLEAREAARFLPLHWLLLLLLAPLPFAWQGIAYEDAFFFAATAVTTTAPYYGAYAQDTLFFWQALLGWGGGLSFLVLSFTVMPQTAEELGLTLSTEGNAPFSPLFRRMRKIARQMLWLYLGLTVLAFLLFLIAGMSFRWALPAALLCVSTTGAAQTVPLNNPWALLVGALLFFLASGNFLVYRRALWRRSLRPLWQDREMRFLFLLAGCGAIFLWCMLVRQSVNMGQALILAIFEAAAYVSTAGSLAIQPIFLSGAGAFFLLLLSLVGGSIASVGGGFHAMRFLVLCTAARLEILRTFHPHMIVSIKVGTLAVPPKTFGRILTFFFLYVFTLFCATLILAALGAGALGALAAAIASLTATGQAASLFFAGGLSALPMGAKIFCVFLMLLGRMIVFPFFLLIAAGTERVWKP